MRNRIKLKVLYIQIRTKLARLAPEKYRDKIIISVVKDISKITKYLITEYKKLGINIK